jgi:hypothetical protein
LAEKLCSITDSATKPAGCPYFISDDSPIENFEFLKFLCLSRNRIYPSTVLSVELMFIVSGLCELIYYFGRSFGFTIDPPLTRAEVAKVGVSHYFSIKNATDDFGYHAKFDSREGGRRLKAFYRSFPQDNYFAIADWFWYVAVLTGMSLLASVAFLDIDTIKINWILNHVLNLGLLIFQSKENLQTMFYCAVLVHLLEAMFVTAIAITFCPNTALLWFVQTLLLGYPSAILLLDRSKPK